MKKNYSLTDYSLLIELIPDLVFIKDLDGVFIHANEKYLNYIGKKKEDVIGKTDFDFLSQGDANRITKNDQFIIDSKNTQKFYDVIKKDNYKNYFKTTKSPLFNEKKQIIGIFCIAKNVTKEKHLEIIKNDTNVLLEYIAKEVDLSKTLNKIVSLAETKDLDIKCSILLLDKDKLCCGVAPSLPDFYNKATNGLKIGDKVGSCGSAAYNKKRVIVDNIDTHENWANFLELSNKANLHSCWSEPILSSKNEVIGTFAMYSNYHKKPCDFEIMLIETYAYISSIAIEKYNDFEKILKQEKIIYEQTKLASMGEMIGNIAHQWRQPLSIISSVATGAKLQNKLGLLNNKSIDSYFDTINDTAQHLSEIIEDFRSFFNPTNKKKEFNISNTINKTLHLLSSQFIEKNIQIIKNIEDYELISIENEMIQVLMNILNNARDALLTKENQERFIFIDIYRKDNISYIKILDNAGGIDESIIDRIFEPYFTTKHQSQGTGIGLYMSEEIIRKHLNGNLFVSNKKFTYEGIEYIGAEFIIGIIN